MSLVVLEVDDHIVYGQDFKQCIIMLDDLGLSLDNGVPQRCYFIEVELGSKEYDVLMNACNDVPLTQ